MKPTGKLSGAACLWVSQLEEMSSVNINVNVNVKTHV